MNNIKLDLTNLLDEIIAGGKYSNLQLNYYFSTKGYNKKEKSFFFLKNTCQMHEGVIE
mgnify:CR=1 FL=1